MTDNSNIERVKQIVNFFLNEPIASRSEVVGVGICFTQAQPNVCSPYCLKVNLEKDIPQEVKDSYKNYRGTFVEFEVTGIAYAFKSS